MNEVVQAMVTRRSCRQYWDRPVPEELLDQVLLAGTYAANGRGRQAGRIVVLTKKEDITALEKLNAQALGNPEAQPFMARRWCWWSGRQVRPHGGGGRELGHWQHAPGCPRSGFGSLLDSSRREEFESPEGKTLLAKWGITGDYIGVGHCILGYPPQRPRPLPPRKENFVTKFKF